MEVKKNLKAALYIRVSTEEQAQDSQSPSAQAETLRQYCSAFSIDIFDTYMDLGLSGKSLKDRRELKRLVDDCSSGQFDMVLVWKISRLSRNLKDLLYLIDIFERNNVHFSSCSEKFDTSTPVGRMTLQLLGSIAEFERNTIIENVKLGLREFARKGGKSSSVLGYDNIDKKLVINEEEARIVMMIFKLYAEEAMSCSAIAQHLNSLGLRTKRGYEFRGSNISYIIHNPVYIGINRHCMNRSDEYNVMGAHPPLIETELWNTAQKKSHGRKQKDTASPKTYTGSLFITYCMKCKMPMRIFYSYSKGNKYKYMRCCACSNYVNEEKLIKAVSEAIIEALRNKDLQKNAYRLIMQDSCNSGPEAYKAASLDSEIMRLKKSKARYLSLFENYKISDSKTFLDRIAELDLQIELLDKKKQQLWGKVMDINDTTECENYIDKLKIRLSALEHDVLKQLFGCLVKRIEAYKDEISIVLYL